SVTASNSVEIICNQQVGQQKGLGFGLFLALHLLFLDGAFMGLPITCGSADYQVGALLADF
ncbi:MAG: hypothetical protein AB2604_23525, partial [Candidatus Thiodiazotropha taylori]